jgi:SAM-dependent methyltransferase
MFLMNHEAMWSARYRDAGEDYLFGVAPNKFLAERSDVMKKGQTVLSIADGEGRNSVWLAEQGLAVTAVEIAAVAVDKAKKLAAERGVSVAFEVADIFAPNWPPAPFVAAFDWVVGIFIQFAAPNERARQFAAMKQATRPGGRILLQGYTPAQLNYRTGGPSAIENLYTADMLRDAFSDWDIEELIEYEDDLSEGARHQGRSALIGLVARKPL